MMHTEERARPRDEGGDQGHSPRAARVAVVIASVPGVAEQSLRATLESFASVEVVGSAAGCLSALQMVRDTHADLVVIDSNLPIEDVQAFLRQIKQDGLPTRSLVLAATSAQVRGALAAGADAALRRDEPCGELSAAISGFRRGDLLEIEEDYLG